MKLYTVYMHISPNNKRYIGITSTDTKRRWKNGSGYKTQKYFYRAIEKYGWDNFQHVIIVKGLTEDDAKWLEVELIREWDTTNKEKGYNISFGGDTGASQQGENNPMYGKNAYEGKTEEEMKIIGEKIRVKLSGENNVGAKSVVCITTGKSFNVITDAMKEYNIKSSGQIGKCCRGEVKYCGRLSDGTPLTWMYLDDYKNASETDLKNKIRNANKERNKREENPRATSIICITTGKTFRFIVEASEYYKCNYGHIGACCRKERKSCGKLKDGTPLKWMYLSDFLEKCNYISL